MFREHLMSDEDSVALQTSEDGGSNRIAWFITGAVIGATVAMLYAPKSGKDTRQFIADSTQKGKGSVQGTSRDLVDGSRELFERGRKVVEDAADLFDRARKLVRG
jgi:gas vesicle protein